MVSECVPERRPAAATDANVHLRFTEPVDVETRWFGLWYTNVYEPAARVPLEVLPADADAFQETFEAAMWVVPGPEKVLESA